MTASVILAINQYGWDVHIWDLPAIDLIISRKVSVYIFSPFQDTEADINAMLKRLLFLAVFYEEKIGDNENFTWTDFTFLERITGHTPMRVTIFFTEADHSLFRRLDTKDLLTNSTDLRRMSSRWSELAKIVKACCVVYGESGIMGQLSKISEVCESIASNRLLT